MAALPDPFARYLHPAETAELVQDGRHCDIRRCGEPITVYGWYRRREGDLRLGHERYLCTGHGADFARRHHLQIEAAPADADVPSHRRPDTPWVLLYGMSADMLEAHRAAGWHCDAPRCREGARYLASRRYRLQSGRMRQEGRFLSDRHAENFAARHGVDMGAVTPPEGESR